jgi:hypothetical protein
MSWKASRVFIPLGVFIFRMENDLRELDRIVNVALTPLNISTPQHLNTSTPQHLNASTPQHLNTSTSQRLNVLTPVPA